MKKWLDKYMAFKKEVINRIAELVEKYNKETKEISLQSKYKFPIYIQDEFSGEYIDFTLIAVTDWGVKLLNNYEDRDKAETTKNFNDLDVNELIAICDFLEDNEEILKKQ